MEAERREREREKLRPSFPRPKTKRKYGRTIIDANTFIFSSSSFILLFFFKYRKVVLRAGVNGKTADNLILIRLSDAKRLKDISLINLNG